jgi:hypothetical protein
MVGLPLRRVHGEAGIPHRCPAFPQAVSSTESQSWGMSCAQIAIIPMNSVNDASAAASSTKIFNITTSFAPEHRENIVPFLFSGQVVA